MKNKYIKLYIPILCFIGSISLLSAEPIRIMPLGDSITYDNRVADLTNPRPRGERTAYRSHLWYSLQDAQYSADFVGSQRAGENIIPPFDPDNEGHPGWGFDDIGQNILTYLNHSKPNIILLHIGTNNGSSSSPYGMNLILDEINYYKLTVDSNLRVIIALIINTQDNDPITRTLNKRLNQLLTERIISGEEIEIVDMYRGANLTSQDYSDRYHPTDNGYKKMANLWLNTIISPKPNFSLYSYPYTHINKYDIESITVDGNTNTVYYITDVPDNGITF